MVRFKNVESKHFNELNKAELRGVIIDCLLAIEKMIDKIIVDYFKPEKEGDFNTILLNGSIVDIGSKLKILNNIGINNKLVEKIRRLSAIRNGFAHGSILSSTIIHFNDSGIHSTEESSVILVMNSQGKLMGKNASEYLEEFLRLYKEIKDELQNTTANKL